MGVTKLGNKWRAAFRVGEEDIQVYCDAPDEAYQLCWLAQEIRKRVIHPWVKRRAKRRSNAKAQDLPVGFTDSYGIKNGKKQHFIKVYMPHRTALRCYGIGRSRDQAIKELLILALTECQLRADEDVSAA